MNSQESSNCDEALLLASVAQFYSQRQASQNIFDLMRTRGNAQIGAEAFCRAFDQLNELICINPPSKWPTLAAAYFDFICYAGIREDLCFTLGQTGSLERTFRLAASNALSHNNLIICTTLMEAAKNEPSRSWLGILAQAQCIPDCLLLAAASLTAGYDGRIVSEFFRLADGNAMWSASLADAGVLVQAIDGCRYKSQIALDLLQKAAANPLIKQGVVESGSLREIYHYVESWKNVVPFQIQCVEPWARSIFPALPKAAASKACDLSFT